MRFSLARKRANSMWWHFTVGANTYRALLIYSHITTVHLRGGTSQFIPLKPLEQAQVQLYSSYSHTPSFLQGLLAHRLGAGNIKNHKTNLFYKMSAIVHYHLPSSIYSGHLQVVHNKNSPILQSFFICSTFQLGSNDWFQDHHNRSFQCFCKVQGLSRLRSE